MKGVFAAAGLSLLGCGSGSAPSWGSVGGFPLVPAESFFVPGQQANGDSTLVLTVANQMGYCSILQQNPDGYPANLTFATFTFSNPLGAGQVNPGPGTYPVSAAPGAAPSAQADFAGVLNCAQLPLDAATGGSVVMGTLNGAVTQMTGSLDVQFGAEGSLSGSFEASLCDTSNAPQGESQCYR